MNGKRRLSIHTRRLAVAFLLVTVAKSAVASDQCLSDLEVLPAFLLENDTGAKDELAALGQAHFDAALSQARVDAARADDSAGCDKVLNIYLKSWRNGHLRIGPVPQPNTSPDAAKPDATTPRLDATRLPTVRFLSNRTALLTLPTFASQYLEPLTRLLARYRKLLAAHVNWIIDVRDNDGGSDSTFYPLLPWLIADEREDVGASWLATPANIEGQEKGCAIFAPGDKDCEQSLAEAVTRMRAAPPGSYVQQEDGPPIHFLRVEKLEPRRPRRVAVLIDRNCGSSCEEFLLAVRQSFTVKLLGRRSRGSLDYSNLRPRLLPSGARVLMYAVSRTNRLPGLPVDIAGVAPDIYLAEPVDNTGRVNEVLQIRRWLEGGSLAPKD